MNTSIKKQVQHKNLKKLFNLAWSIAYNNGIDFSKALSAAWVIYKNKNIILSFVATPSKSDTIINNHSIRNLNLFS